MFLKRRVGGFGRRGEPCTGTAEGGIGVGTHVDLHAVVDGVRHARKLILRVLKCIRITMCLPLITRH